MTTKVLDCWYGLGDKVQGENKSYHVVFINVSEDICDVPLPHPHQLIDPILDMFAISGI